ncbi:MAG: hypothetical protein VB108_03600 [Anaerolineaceae bacterium]|nr:hypothetical protein [Anaerolineaceae bacterium]
MNKHEKFSFPNLEALEHKISSLGLSIPLSEDLKPFEHSLEINGNKCPNRIAVLPMEGCDSEADGSPSKLVYRRYKRFFEGGAGLIWWEANAVVQEGRANELQMMLTSKNQKSFSHLLETSILAGKAVNGECYQPISILQLTHSGRYSRPVGHKPQPLIPQHDPILDPRLGIGPDDPLISDAYLDSLIEAYVHSARLAEEAGFDGVDIKACHRYLISELLASHTREGCYGGSFENRSRLLLKIIEEVRAQTNPNFIVACRFNVFDAHPYPYGFGVEKNDFWKFDPSEPILLVKRMIESGVNLLSNSAGNPYYIYPQVTRPFDLSSEGIPVPEEHPLKSIERLFSFTEEIQKTAGKIPVVGNGYSWLREFMPFAGAANVRLGRCSLMGIGRNSFAYPDAPKDILMKGMLDKDKCCITCSKCTQMMRDHGTTGCVIKDAAIYAPLYRHYHKEAQLRAR